MLAYYRLQPLSESVLRLAWGVRNRHGFSIWDSQIIAAALESGCSILYTEDLQHGQRIESLEVINPLQRKRRKLLIIRKKKKTRTQTGYGS